MTLTSEEQNLINELRDILDKRLEYNATWAQVRIKLRKTYLEITWFDNLHFEDPRGAVYYETKRIAPFNVKNLKGVVDRQRKNLEKDLLSNGVIDLDD